LFVWFRVRGVRVSLAPDDLGDDLGRAGTRSKGRKKRVVRNEGTMVGFGCLLSQDGFEVLRNGVVSQRRVKLLSFVERTKFKARLSRVTSTQITQHEASAVIIARLSSLRIPRHLGDRCYVYHCIVKLVLGITMLGSLKCNTFIQGGHILTRCRDRAAKTRPPRGLPELGPSLLHVWGSLAAKLPALNSTMDS